MTIILFILALLFVPIGAPLAAQTHLSIDLDDPVYILLETCVGRGIIPQTSLVKPYPESVVLGYLDDIYEKKELLSPVEQSILENTIAGLTEVKSGLEYGKFQDEGKLGEFTAGIQLDFDERLNFNNTDSVHSSNALRAYMEGDIADNVSYKAVMGGSLDIIAPDLFYRNTDAIYGGPDYYILDGEVQFYTTDDYTGPGCFAPYQYVKTWDGHHITFDGSDLSDGVSDSFSAALQAQDEIASVFFDGDLILRSGKFDREWGHGDGSLFLSGTASSFEGIETMLEPVPWFSYAFIVGSLGDWFVDSRIGRDDPDIDDDDLEDTDSDNSYDSEQKMISLQQFEVRPWSWLSLNMNSAAIWGKRFEMAYLSPMLMPFISQEFSGDMDNVNLSVGFASQLPFDSKLYGTWFVDEISNFGLDTFFTDVRNMFAYQGGLKVAVPGIPFGVLTLQYTKIEPFTYTHYSESNYPTYQGIEVGLAYTHDGLNLGYYLPPNSDEFLVKLSSLPLPNLKAELKYQLIRHGTNDYESGSYLIYGDINRAISYSHIDEYPDKDFLNDGVYDWNNIISVSAEYAFGELPLEIGLTYFLSYTYWELNGYEVVQPDPVMSNVVALSVTIFP